MKTKASLKQQRFVRSYLKSGNGTEAAMQHYDVSSRNSAAQVASRNLKSENVQNYMRELLDDSGLSDREISTALKAIVAAGTSKKALSKAETSDALRALEMTNKLKDNYPVERKRIDKSSVNLDLSLEGKSQAELMEMLAETQKEIREFQEMMKKDNRLSEGVLAAE